MALIKWRDSFSVGVEKFDKEHLKLVELINDMYIIVRDKGDVTALSACIERLIEYTRFHFSSEEAAMEEANYPGLEEHKKLHAGLEEQAVGFFLRVKSEGEAVRTEFYHFLREWLVNHMVEEDKKYSEYLKPS
ncbi:MAG: hemerythrin family protein [Desulfobulbaceae bacterium]|nr:hemerythrin family protein [Desulfobulbaceae bacterium]